jgi:serine/threonine protein kinase
MVMECAVDGNLRDYLDNRTLTWDNKINLAYQLASAVLCLHDEGIVHRDLVIFYNLSIILKRNINLHILIKIILFNNSTPIIYWYIDVKSK